MNLAARNFCIVGIAFLVLSLPLFGLETGDKAPPFANPDLQKKHVLSKDYLGKSWLILDFFATDCEGCKKEIPILEQLFADLRAEGLKILVFATDPEGHAVVEPYFQRIPTTLTVLVDRYQVVTKKYGVSEIPSLFLVNPEVVVVYKAVGFKEDLYDQILAHLSPRR